MGRHWGDSAPVHSCCWAGARVFSKRRNRGAERMISDAILRRLTVIVPIIMVAAGCASTPPTDVTCTNSERFRLEVQTAPIADMLLNGEAITPAQMRPGSVESAIFGAMTNFTEEQEARGIYPRRNIAVLSGGGQFGAYGAGFFDSYLSGAGEGVEFDVVTGVSTGALQATGIFLGGEDDLDGLVEAYAIERETDLATRRRSIAGLPLETSIYDLAPARLRFADYLTDERIARVAEKAREGRKLLAGVVEVQDGQFYAFDLTAIAASDRPSAEIRQCYTEAVFASAAVPVIFPPVLLDGRQYFDGGVRAAVFLDTTLKALTAMKAEYAKEAKVYTLFNGSLETPPQDDLAISVLDALNRTRAIAFDQIDRTSLQRIALLADRFDVNWARIEPGLCVERRDEAPDEEVFNAPFMNCLIAEGQLAGAGASPFAKIPPQRSR